MLGLPRRRVGPAVSSSRPREVAESPWSRFALKGLSGGRGAAKQIHELPGSALHHRVMMVANVMLHVPASRPLNTDDPAIRMKPQPESSTQEVLAGLVERVTFHNAENGFCVLRAKARGHRELVTVIGHAPIISAGEWITATGDWVNDRTHGQQFKARFLRTSAPTSAEGIEKYLSSGMIRGVGPAYAKKLVRAFGEKVFDVIEAAPDRLREVDGIGPVRAASILAAWAEQKAVREIMVFLHSHGVGTARAVRIFKSR